MYVNESRFLKIEVNKFWVLLLNVSMKSDADVNAGRQSHQNYFS